MQAPCGIDLWYVNADLIDAAVLNSCRAWLSPEECERTDRFIRPVDRQRRTAARALTRWSLSQYAACPPSQWRFATNAFGKPRIDDPFSDGVLASSIRPGQLHFNVSHAGPWVFCAVAKREVGVDIEPIDREVSAMELATRFFAAEESAWLRSLPFAAQRKSFMRLWTVKEAVVKALGRGLSIGLERFVVSFASDARNGSERTQEAAATTAEAIGSTAGEIIRRECRPTLAWREPLDPPAVELELTQLDMQLDARSFYSVSVAIEQAGAAQEIRLRGPAPLMA